MDKPREFWIYKNRAYINPQTSPTVAEAMIHVIEYSAYETLQVQIKALETQREVLHVILAGYISNPPAKKEE